MTRSTPNLLRRTLVLLGAAAGLLAGAEVLAQGTVTLTGATGNNCAYSSMSVSPNGTVTVQCSGSGNPPPTTGQAFFTLSGPSTIAANTSYTSGEFKVTRTDNSGPSGTVAFGYTVSGTGCNFASVGPFWLTPAGGSKPSENLSVTTTSSGTCTITLTIQEGHSGSAPASWTVGTTTPPVTPPSGCPAAATGSMDRTANIGALTMSGSGVDQLRMDSGTIAYYRVPAAPNPAQSVLIYLTQGQQPNLPAGFVTEMSVSKCPGVVTNTNNACYRTSSFANNNSIGIYTAAVPAYGWNSQEAIGDRGCYAPVAEANYYVNIRWTYPTCPWGSGSCGTSLQWAPTGSNF